MSAGSVMLFFSLLNPMHSSLGDSNFEIVFILSIRFVVDTRPISYRSSSSRGSFKHYTTTSGHTPLPAQ